MKAITIHQPWAWAIIHAGKNIENRTWQTKHRGPLAIHASKRRHRGEYQYARQVIQRILRDAGKSDMGVPRFEEAIRGAIIGTVEVTGIALTEPESRWWWTGPVGWMLSKQHATAPQKISGQQGLWTVDDALIVEYPF